MLPRQFLILMLDVLEVDGAEVCTKSLVAWTHDEAQHLIVHTIRHLHHCLTQHLVVCFFLEFLHVLFVEDLLNLM